MQSRVKLILKCLSSSDLLVPNLDQVKALAGDAAHEYLLSEFKTKESFAGSDGGSESVPPRYQLVYFKLF